MGVVNGRGRGRHPVDGGDDFSAIEVLRGQAKLFGEVASDSTAWRRVRNLADDELALARVEDARRAARVSAWRAGAAPAAVTDPSSGPLFIDVDATLVTSHSDGKERTAGTYKGGWGFHPLLAYLDRGDGTRRAGGRGCLWGTGAAGPLACRPHESAVVLRARHLRHGVAHLGSHRGWRPRSA
jgi:hypothetical protein